jgi:hypothetical protein
MWKVNAGRRSALAHEFLTRGVVAIGCQDASDHARLPLRRAVLDAVVRACHLGMMTADGPARALVADDDQLDERSRTLLPPVQLCWPA